MTDHVSALRIEPISREHQRDSFQCGKPPLDAYLHQYARQNDEKNIAKTFVAVNDANKVMGYYSLCTASIEFEELPDDLNKQLPAYPAPAALIAKLAVDASLRGQGLGARLLVDALQRIFAASGEVAIKVVLVDALDDEARDFYLHYDFIQLPMHDYKLFLPIETVAQLFAE